MTSIIVYTTEEVLLHKQGKKPDDMDYSDTGDYYWKFQLLPRNASIGDNIYFATKGFVKGFFKISYIQFPDIGFNCESWKPLQRPVSIKHFRGFKYADKEGLE